jgi:transposase
MQPGEVLLFTDWTLLRLFPPLRCAWAKIGQQAQVPVSGSNAKRVLFGAINPRTGHRIVVRRNSAGGRDAQAFLREIRRRYRGRVIWLLLDRAPGHTDGRTQALAGVKKILLVWLPKQCPELNGMDHLWRELKRLIAANRQAKTIDELAEYAEQWILHLSKSEALRKAGILSKNFWLKKPLQNFWRVT